MRQRDTRGNQEYRSYIVDYNPPRNSILRVLYIAIVSLWESRYFTEFVKSDFEGLLANCGLRVERERPTYFGLLRIWVCCKAD